MFCLSNDNKIIVHNTHNSKHTEITTSKRNRPQSIVACANVCSLQTQMTVEITYSNSNLIKGDNLYSIISVNGFRAAKHKKCCGPYQCR